jgi:hypothetical protein
MIMANLQAPRYAPCKRSKPVSCPLTSGFWACTG